MFTLQVEKENHMFCMRFDPLFKNTNLAWSREKEGKKGWLALAVRGTSQSRDYFHFINNKAELQRD